MLNVSNANSFARPLCGGMTLISIHVMSAAPYFIPFTTTIRALRSIPMIKEACGFILFA